MMRTPAWQVPVFSIFDEEERITYIHEFIHYLGQSEFELVSRGRL